MRGRPGLDRDYLVWDTGLYAVQRAVRTKSHLMIRTYDDFGYAFDPVELYDMRVDPYQTHNLATEQPQIVQQCSYLMEEWLQIKTSSALSSKTKEENSGQFSRRHRQ